MIFDEFLGGTAHFEWESRALLPGSLNSLSPANNLTITGFEAVFPTVIPRLNHRPGDEL